MFNDLISDLRRATGPDRLLDVRIAHLVGHFDRLLVGMGEAEIASVGYRGGMDRAEVLVRAKGRSTGGLLYDHDVPAFTGSLDAALSLVPDGWEWSLHGMLRSFTAWVANTEDQKAPTPALALCLAGLVNRQGMLDAGT